MLAGFNRNKNNNVQDMHVFWLLQVCKNKHLKKKKVAVVE